MFQMAALMCIAMPVLFLLWVAACQVACYAVFTIYIVPG